MLSLGRLLSCFIRHLSQIINLHPQLGSPLRVPLPSSLLKWVAPFGQEPVLSPAAVRRAHWDLDSALVLCNVGNAMQWLWCSARLRPKAIESIGTLLWSHAKQQHANCRAGLIPHIPAHCWIIRLFQGIHCSWILDVAGVHIIFFFRKIT